MPSSGTESHQESNQHEATKTVGKPSESQNRAQQGTSKSLSHYLTRPSDSVASSAESSLGM